MFGNIEPRREYRAGWGEQRDAKDAQGREAERDYEKSFRGTGGFPHRTSPTHFDYLASTISNFGKSIDLFAAPTAPRPKFVFV